MLDYLRREGAEWALDAVSEFGRKAASAEGYELGFLANRNPPQLRTHDRFGNRIDQVEFHPAWHQLLDVAIGNGLHSLPWDGTVPEHGHLVRTSLTFLASQIEAGHFCPVSMTYAAIPALRQQPDLAAEWAPMMLSRAYDRSFQPAAKKSGVLIGMGMTEKQGGSDVRTNTTIAEPTNDGYRVTGHKWFTSAPMNDAFLVLAQAPGGLTCFLLPRFTPDGAVNEIRIQRLKDKLGNRSNASAELEFEGAFAHRIGEEGLGISTIIEMVNGTRLDCVAGSAALMRQAVSQAIHHCRHRRAFGAELARKPAMQNVLADLEIETEASVLLMMRVATSFDQAGQDDHEQALRRIITPLAKYWVTKRCAGVVHEALECLGGNGYVEDSILPRLFRESPLNAIWEGSGNVIALDVLRALTTNPASVEALTEELRLGGGHHPAVDRFTEQAIDGIHQLREPESQARTLAGHLAVALEAGLLARFGNPMAFAGFVQTRIEGTGGLYGTLPVGIDFAWILEPSIPG